MCVADLAFTIANTGDFRPPSRPRDLGHCAEDAARSLRYGCRVPNRASLDDAAVLDWLAAAGLLGLALLEALFGPVTSPRWQQALISVAWTLPLGWRRRFPIGVLVVVMGAGAAMGYVNTEGGLRLHGDRREGDLRRSR